MKVEVIHGRWSEEVELTQEICHSAGSDAGNHSMRLNNRTAWDETDWNAAAAEFNRLMEILQADR